MSDNETTDEPFDDQADHDAKQAELAAEREEHARRRLGGDPKE